MLDDVLLAEDRDAADLAVELPDGEREGGVVEDGAVRAVVQRVNELQVAAAAVWKMSKVFNQCHPVNIKLVLF